MRDQRPVIITDLYDRDPVRAMGSLAEVRRRLGHACIQIGKNYYESMLGEAGGSRFTSVSGYLKLIETQPETELMCSEERMPPALRRLIRVPRLPGFREGAAATMMYMANRGTVAPLHFDGDQREVLFTQVIGHKRIFIMPPRVGARFYSISSMCGVAVHRFEEAERQAFFSANEAWTCVLGPFETLYIPRLWWHYLENLEVTLAFGVRVGLTAASRKLRLLPFNYLTQNISDVLIDPMTGRSRDEDLVMDLLAVQLASYATPEARLDALERALVAAYHRVCAGAVRVPYLPSWFTARGGDHAWRSKWLGHREPVLLGDGDLERPARARHLRKLAGVAAKVELGDRAVARVARSFGFPAARERMSLLQATILANAISRTDTRVTEA